MDWHRTAGFLAREEAALAELSPASAIEHPTEAEPGTSSRHALSKELVWKFQWAGNEFRRSRNS